jgi:hypothetical protein
MTIDPDTPQMEDHFARLERELIDEYIRQRGHDPAAIRKSDDPAAHKLLADAATHAAGKITEVESRSHLKHDLHE